MLFPNFEQLRTTMQQANMIHAVAALVMMAFALGHIYMGTIGVEGAYGNMRDGVTDETWAKEHHELWYDDVKSGKVAAKSGAARATDTALRRERTMKKLWIAATLAAGLAIGSLAGVQAKLPRRAAQERRREGRRGREGRGREGQGSRAERQGEDKAVANYKKNKGIADPKAPAKAAAASTSGKKIAKELDFLLGRLDVPERRQQQQVVDDLQPAAEQQRPDLVSGGEQRAGEHRAGG